VVGSTISRLTDFGLFTRAGTEVWVASTKAFTAQICTILLLVLYFGEKNWNLSRQKYRQIIQELHHIPEKINKLLSTSDDIRNIAENIKNYKQFFFLGRHLELAIAYESSLKFKEISYLNSQALPSGELNHWSLALVDEQFPSIIFMPNDFLYEKNLSSVQEVKARKWEILAISDKKVPSATWNISIPETLEELYPFLTAIAGQIVAYHTADLLGRNIDKPRNLAKSVTVK
jgi:glucosamine--fructose-6-phosphate aminotransferase (isomerizing)